MIANMVTIIQSAINGINPANFFPGTIQWLEGKPKKYFMGPGDLTTRNAIIHVHRVERIIVTMKSKIGKDPR